MWLRHWNMTRDPFPAQGGSYVATPPHDEAVARVVHAVRSGERLAVVRAGSGLGKSMVLTRALSEARMPGLRIARADAPPDAASLHAQIARSLRLRPAQDRSQHQIWQSLTDAARLIAAQRGRLVIAVDDAHRLADRLDLDRLLCLDSGSTVTILSFERPRDDDSHPDAFSIRLDPLTRSESSAYLAAKLHLAGRDTPLFSPAAMTRLHALTAGVPRRLDRLAGLALRDAAVQGQPLITEGRVEVAFRETHPAPLAAWGGSLMLGADGTW